MGKSILAMTMGALFLAFFNLVQAGEGENTYLLVQINPEIQNLAGRWTLLSSTFGLHKNEDYYFEIEVRGREATMYEIAKHDIHVGGPRYVEKGTKIEFVSFHLNGRSIEGSWRYHLRGRSLVKGIVSEDWNEIKFSLYGDPNWYYETFQCE